MTIANTDPNKTRLSLLEGIKDPSNQKRWMEFHEKYSKLIRDVALRKGLRHDEAEDLVQTVLIEISQKIGDFKYDRSKGQFRSCLKTIASRRCIDAIRKRRPAEENKQHRSPSDQRDTNTIDRITDHNESDLETIIDDEWKRAILTATLQRVREKVTPQQYQLFDSYVLKEWPIEKVSSTFGVTPNQIYIAKTRVGKIAEEEGARVTEEMDAPDIPSNQSNSGLNENDAR